MDLNGGRQSTPPTGTPKRPSTGLIVLLIAAAVLVIWAAFSIRIEIALPEAWPPAPMADADGAASVSNQREGTEVVATPVGPADPATDERAHWSRPPRPELPAAGVHAPGGEGRVTLTCLIQADQSLGDCRVLAESPEGFSFAGSAIEAARQARVTNQATPGARVIFTTRFVPPGS